MIWNPDELARLMIFVMGALVAAQVVTIKVLG